jgi:hypothetical protein
MSDLTWLASLVRSRNTIDSKIAGIIGRTAQINNVGEYIASVVFNIKMEVSEHNRKFDGRFTNGPLSGSTVDVHWKIRYDGLLNIKPEAVPDYYLIFTGPTTSAPDRAGTPWLIERCFLFRAHNLLIALQERGVQIGTGTSITGPLWERAEIYPIPRNNGLVISDEQRRMLFLFN